MLGDFDVQRGVVYLKQLDVNRADELMDSTSNLHNATSRLNLSSEEDSDDETSTEIDAVFDTASAKSESLKSAITRLTTDSDREAALVAAQSNPAPFYAPIDFWEILESTTKKVKLEEFKHITGVLDIGMPQYIWEYLANLTLGECPVSKECHTFSEDERCIRCMVQLCRVS